MSNRIAMVILSAVAALAPGCGSSRPPAITPAASENEVVILLHGLARTGQSMNRMKQSLMQAGYTVYTLQYPTTKKPVETLADEYLAPLIASCQTRHPEKVHFVAHSLGNIVLRYYFANHTLPNPGRIVMLGPPNRGSEVVDKLGDLSLFVWMNGPAGQQLGTSSNALPNRLPAPPLDVGVIAGTRSINGLLSLLIPGKDDGKVSIERTKLEGMKDFATVNTSHPFLMRDRQVIRMTAAFLRDGSFTGQ